MAEHCDVEREGGGGRPGLGIVIVRSRHILSAFLSFSAAQPDLLVPRPARQMAPFPAGLPSGPNGQVPRQIDVNVKSAPHKTQGFSRWTDRALE
jgi:hypothetical protein